MGVIIDTRVRGIPCRVVVHSYAYHRPRPHITDSDIDHRGGYEIDYEILDRRGRPAQWLESRATEVDRRRILDTIEGLDA